MAENTEVDLTALLAKIKGLAADWENVIFSDTARWDRLKGLRYEYADVRHALLNAKRVLPAAHGSFVVEGNKRDRWNFGVVVRLGEGEKLYVAKLIG